MHLQKCPVKGQNHERHIFRHYGSALMFYSLQILHLYSRRLTLVSESYTLWAQDSSGAINKQSKRKDDGIVHLKKILFTSGHQEVTLIHTSLLHVQTTCTHTHTQNFSFILMLRTIITEIPVGHLHLVPACVLIMSTLHNCDDRD